ncbi:DUF3540 domain-containing protein [Chondromyces apiculatus]|uniref:DUF3540 domain-containing protein n=1 Tax=Chondromyces apiculatus DSM 436 TaxID=1192034 RepID=A0A017TA61_9BACT|nr:DUF3540 domain-containing protein [Chondromyces apiculatus]EYF05501.1 Hypothetical protein CAP_3229 [Chondromyces apiculatus DSM 436]
MRDNLARKLALPPQEAATVTGIAGRVLRVRSGSGEFEARRAASCLLDPGLGDLVLLAHHERGSHVLAVLERDEEAPARLSADGDLEIAAASGRVTVSGRDGIDMLTPGEAVLAAGTARVSSQRADASIGVLNYLGDQVTAQVDRVKTVAQSVETVASRLVQRLDRAYRFIARSETVRAEYVEVEARAAYVVKSETTLMNSAALTKIDSSQIHLG